MVWIKAWVKGAASSPCPISKNKKEQMRELREILAKHRYKLTI